jgi:hypothetical protein
MLISYSFLIVIILINTLYLGWDIYLISSKLDSPPAYYSYLNILIYL